MKQCRVLLVDDEIEFVTTLAERLELRGFKPLVVHDGESALRALADADSDPPFQAVLLDLRMPGMEGTEVLRRMDPGMRARVVVLTGHGSEKERRECMDLGAADYLGKPAELPELDAALRRAAGNGENGGGK
ncbi:response regulator [Desulfohalovibrio reitneri]|uniref:response regulator n=1 Tax=Desulfohalovibrio reitneri TaxID=1307759 RepID=UPI0004A6AE87|nr:response regulator [Desulfohalovibrio reitneri]